MRIALFLLTNLAVLVVASIVLSVLQGVFGIQGDTTGLLLFCAVFGMTGALISLLLSKTLARRATRTRRSEEHTSELQSRGHLVCRLLLEKKNTKEQC